VSDFEKNSEYRIISKKRQDFIKGMPSYISNLDRNTWKKAGFKQTGSAPDISLSARAQFAPPATLWN